MTVGAGEIPSGLQLVSWPYLGSGKIKGNYGPAVRITWKHDQGAAAVPSIRYPRPTNFNPLHSGVSHTLGTTVAFFTNEEFQDLVLCDMTSLGRQSGELWTWEKHKPDPVSMALHKLKGRHMQNNGSTVIFYYGKNSIIPCRTIRKGCQTSNETEPGHPPA